MEKHSFIVKSDTDIIINLIVDDISNIKVDDDKYTISYDTSKIFLTRENEETKFNLTCDSSIKEAIITLKKTNTVVSIPIEKIDYSIDEEGFILTYKLVSMDSSLDISLKKFK